MSKKRDLSILIISVILLITINYNYLDDKLENFLSTSEIAVVERVIDGDTIEIENKTSVRLLGINSPEKGEFYYDEAKEFLNKQILNKTIRLEFGKDKYDMYQRILAYVYDNNQNVNLEIVRNGLANYYFPSGKDRHYNEFKKAWEECIQKNKNLCEKSENICANCIELKEFNYNKQEVILHNKCGFNCELNSWTIKDEGRKKFIFPEFVLEKNREVLIIVSNKTNTDEILFWKDEEYVWTKTGDTLFLRDKEGKLVLWNSY